MSCRFSTLAAKRVVGERADRVDALAGRFDNEVAATVDDVYVVAAAADHAVRAGAACQDV